MHADMPVALAYVPMAQPKHEEATLMPLLGLYLPSPHCVQFVAPYAVWYVPTSHSEQDGEPGEAEYEPGAQLKHTAEDVLPGLPAYVPAGHRVQLAVPGAAA